MPFNRNKKPQCVIVTGRPGAGKTTFAKKLADRLHMPLISRDALKEGYVNSFGIQHRDLPQNTNKLVTDLFFEVVNLHLASKISIVIEAAFQHKVWQLYMAEIENLSKPTIIICSVDALTAAKRQQQRRLADPSREFYHGDSMVTEVKPYTPPQFDSPTLEVSTDGAYSPSLETIVDIIST